MTRLFDWLVEVWDWWRALLGFHRFSRKGRGHDLDDKGFMRRLYYFVRPVVMLIVLIYLGTMIWRFSWIRGEDLTYPQTLITAQAPVSAGTETEPESGAASAQTCERSQIVEIQIGLLDFLVNQNDCRTTDLGQMRSHGRKHQGKVFEDPLRPYLVLREAVDQDHELRDRRIEAEIVEIAPDLVADGFDPSRS